MSADDFSNFHILQAGLEKSSVLPVCKKIGP